RRSAAYALGCLGNRAGSVLVPLQNALHDPEPAVRQNAAWALGRLGGDAAPALGSALKDSDALVRRDALAALGALQPVDAARPVVAAVLVCFRTDADAAVRKTALTLLVALVGPQQRSAADDFCRALADADVEVRRNAALALSNVGGPRAAEAVPVLREAL